jgi:GTP pyrophosphokinase
MLSKAQSTGDTPNSDIIRKLLENYELINKDEIYSRIGLGLINLDYLRKILKKAPEGSLRKYWKLAIGGVTRKTAETREQSPLPGTINKDQTYLLREIVDNTGNTYVIASLLPAYSR